MWSGLGCVTRTRMAKRGRPLIYPERLNLAVASGVCERLDLVREEGETRLEVIREAIDRELVRREGMRPRPSPRSPKAPT